MLRNSALLPPRWRVSYTQTIYRWQFSPGRMGKGGATEGITYMDEGTGRMKEEKKKEDRLEEIKMLLHDLQFDLKMLLPVHLRKEQVLLDGPRIFFSLIRGLN